MTLKEQAEKLTQFCLNNVYTDKDGVLFYPDGVVPSVLNKLRDIRNEALEETAKVPAEEFARQVSKIKSPYEWEAEACGFAAEMERRIVALKTPALAAYGKDDK